MTCNATVKASEILLHAMQETICSLGDGEPVVSGFHALADLWKGQGLCSLLLDVGDLILLRQLIRIDHAMPDMSFDVLSLCHIVVRHLRKKV